MSDPLPSWSAATTLLRLFVGFLLGPTVYAVFATSSVANHYAASLAIYGFAAIAYALTVLRSAKLSKSLVDFFYYTVGIFSVVLFTWIHSEKLRELDLPRGLTLEQAIEQNALELFAANEFSELFHNDTNNLLRIADTYLRDMSVKPRKFKCVYDYREYASGKHGIVLVDPAASLIRTNSNLNMEAPLAVARKCVEFFGGEPVRTSLFTSWKRGKFANYDPDSIPFTTIESTSQIEEDLHVFMGLKLNDSSIAIADFIEFLVGNDGKILTPAEVQGLGTIPDGFKTDLDDQNWFDSLLSQLIRKMGGMLEFAIWPFIAVFLLSLKIAIIWGQK